MKIKCIWFKATGKYYTDGEGEIDDKAVEAFQSGRGIGAFHLAMIVEGRNLPGLSGRFTDLACTVIGDDFCHHFQAGQFDR